MRPPVFSADTLADLLRRDIVATLPDLAAALGQPSPSTVFRKLKQLGYLSSYSHRGRFYALRECARFDSSGLWSHNGIRFSSRGTLRATARALVDSSATGFRPAELDALLGVRTIDALARLARDGHIARARVQRRSLYCSTDAARRERQIAARRIQAAGPAALPALPAPGQPDSSLAAAIALFCSLLNEKQRRLFAGLASLLCGHGGDRQTAALLGLHRKTVGKGRRELVAGDIDPDRVRKAGAGRKSLQKNPWMIGELLRLVANETAGDPMGGLLWTYRSLAKLAAALSLSGVKVSPATVGKWLKSRGYSLRVNRKCLSRAAPPGRDEQFGRITALRTSCRAAGTPVISVDTKICSAEHILVYVQFPHMWS